MVRGRVVLRGNASLLLLLFFLGVVSHDCRLQGGRAEGMMVT